MSSVCLALAFPGNISGADSFAEAARDLAAKIRAGMGPLKNAVFSFHSLASIGAADVDVARRALEKELHTQGIGFVPDSQAAAVLNVTLSENFRQYLWIAEIKRSTNTDFVMTAQERLQDSLLKDIAPYMTVQTRILFEHADPVLDLKVRNDGLMVLHPDRVALYRRSRDQWELERSTPLKSLKPRPRDLRGRFSDDGDAVQIHLPGLFCRGAADSGFAFECMQEEKPWPFPSGDIRLAAAGNSFFRENLPPFFSIAGVAEDEAELWIIAGVDGRAYLYDSTNAQIDAMDDGWGSEIAAIESECGTKRQILVSLRTDPLARGAIQAFEIVNRSVVVKSSPVEFPGPITALWPVAEQDAAIAISRDLKTGHYAAFYLSISCSR
ncbi:MAG: hypothetical protein JXA73_20945 [Acidobacteria bacterium]|nr:hypothetical protein [Acidobacteriota bacterium]